MNARIQIKYHTNRFKHMHIAYSALRTHTINKQTQLVDKQLQQRYDGYQTACAKYKQEIAAIQKYLPGWMPRFL